VNTSQADTLVSGCVLGVLVMGMADDYIVKEQNPSFKFFIAVAITGAALAYTADVSPEAAAWLAIIIFIVVLMEEGAPVLKAIQGSNKIGQVQAKGTGHTDFPVIPFTKDKGKKKPRVIKPRDVPVLPVKVRARQPQLSEHTQKPLIDLGSIGEGAKKVLENLPKLPPPVEYLPEFMVP
jgi:hypothetical protein